MAEARPILPTIEPSARRRGGSRQLLKNDQPIDVGDATIGATGVVREEPVLTGDPDHFERIPGLDVVTY